MDLEMARWRRSPETRQFLSDLEQRFPVVRLLLTTSLQNLPTLRGSAEVLEWIREYTDNG